MCVMKPSKIQVKEKPCALFCLVSLTWFYVPFPFPVSWIIFPGAVDISPAWSGCLWWWDWVASPGTQELRGRKALWFMPESEPQGCLFFWSSLAWQTGSSTLKSQHYRIVVQRRAWRWLNPTIILNQSEILEAFESVRLTVLLYFRNDGTLKLK